MGVKMTWTDLSQGFVRRETIRARRSLEMAAERAAAQIEDRMPWARLEVSADDDAVSIVVVHGGDLVEEAVRAEADEVLRKGGR